MKLPPRSSVTRDSLGMAQKSTSVTIDGIEKDIFKDPVTDDGVKKSAKGRVTVHRRDDNLELDYEDSDKRIEKKDSFDFLEVVFKDGELVRTQTLSQIRDMLYDYK